MNNKALEKQAFFLARNPVCKSSQQHYWQSTLFGMILTVRFDVSTSIILKPQTNKKNRKKKKKNRDSPIRCYRGVSPPPARGYGFLFDGGVNRLQKVAGQVAAHADIVAVVGVIHEKTVTGHAFLRSDVGVVKVGVEDDLQRGEGRGGSGGVGGCVGGGASAETKT